jgi:ankyrin repeat protein
MLLELGADVGARNRRGAQPLHYAADGVPGSAAWDPRGQVAVIETLVVAGADTNAKDASGVTPLHRPVRTRCAAAVRTLLQAGADLNLRNT